MMTALDAEALMLFQAGTTQVAYWDEFTDRQMDHWRAVAMKAREIHAPLPTRHEIAEIVLHHWARDWKDPRYPTAVRCGAEGCDWQGRFACEISEHVADIISGAPSACNPAK